MLKAMPMYQPCINLFMCNDNYLEHAPPLGSYHNTIKDKASTNLPSGLENIINNTALVFLLKDCSLSKGM